jgi:Transglutaminase-like superfamily
MARYGLARHVFVCRDEDYIVVLDLKRDRYFALEAAKTAALASALPGWPSAAAQTPPSQSATDAVAAPLLRQGWLLEASACSKDATPAQICGPEAELTGETAAADPDISWRTVIAFATSSMFAKFALRFWPFERVIRRVADRRAAHASQGQALDLERARRLVAAFERMRVFLFSTRQECLYDSLAVLEFLARHGEFPSWVFGVRARPFAAHCWVQHVGVVFNDTVEHVSTYVPIMVT